MFFLRYSFQDTDKKETTFEKNISEDFDQEEKIEPQKNNHINKGLINCNSHVVVEKKRGINGIPKKKMFLLKLNVLLLE